MRTCAAAPVVSLCHHGRATEQIGCTEHLEARRSIYFESLLNYSYASPSCEFEHTQGSNLGSTLPDWAHTCQVCTQFYFSASCLAAAIFSRNRVGGSCLERLLVDRDGYRSNSK